MSSSDPRRIAIVGAGPAGSSAAIELARRGHTVTLIDRARFPRDKTCGDWITGGALAGLAELGFSPTDLLSRAGEGAIVDGTVVVAPNGRGNLVEATGRSRCVRRRVFDDLLYRGAVEAGARPCTRAIRDLRAEVSRSLADYDAILDARGVYAGRANALALRAYLTAPRDAVDPGVIRRAQLFTDREFSMGYGWMFPVASHERHVTFNYGVGVHRGEQAPDVRGYFARFCRDNPVVAQLCAHAIEIGKPRGHHLALADAPRSVADGRIFAVGDAANLTDPVTGEGIANAIRSGRDVAELLTTADTVEAAARAWQARYERDYVPEFRAARQLRVLLSGTRRKNAALWWLDHDAALARRFHACLEGVASYRSVLPWWSRPLARGLAGFAGGAASATRRPASDFRPMISSRSKI